MSESQQDRFNHLYETGFTPWELDRTDKTLMEIVTDTPISPCKTLELGCGTGSNAIWLAKAGFQVSGADFSSLAIERAKTKAADAGVEIQFYKNDFLTESLGAKNFSFLFDRGCFHSFETQKDRQAFARNAHAHLSDQGMWLSLMGNADAEPRTEGPPMRSALDIVRAVEPWFEILVLKSNFFDSERESPARNWNCLMQKRTV